MSASTCSSCSKAIAAEFSFCPYCGVDLNKPILCPKCRYANEPNSKFCQECGADLMERKQSPTSAARSANVVTEESEADPVPEKGVTIEFPFTAAQSFDFAVKEAAKLPGYQQFGKDKKAIYRVTLSPDQLGNASELLEQLKGWRKRTVYLDGQKAQWDSIFGYSWCHAKKASSYKPEYYCFGYENEYELNLWGCMHARMPFNEHGQWFTWGKWANNRGDWEFDKARIRHELEKNLFQFRFCPALRLDKIEAVLAAIPAIVNPTKDRNWKFVENWSGEAADGLVVTVERFGMKEKVTMKGVCPAGQGALKDIAKKLQLALPMK